jgi:hypothetical protein
VLLLWSPSGSYLRCAHSLATVTTVEPRAFTRLLQIPVADRLGMIAEGLGLIAEHVRTLREAVVHLDAQQRRRSATILGGVADEEAAKALILLDILRSGSDTQEVMVAQLKRASQHLPRCIYAEVVQRRPVTFGEVHDRVDRARLSHYLDGPMDADWILSNELLAEREGNVYVDFVWDIEGNSGQWMTPARLDDIGLGPGTAVQDLLLSLGQTGCLSRRGLDVIADEWHDFDLTEDTPWVKVHDITIRILTRLHEAGDFAETASQADVDCVLERWGFPLGALDLSEITVSREELRAEQQRLLSRWID